MKSCTKCGQEIHPMRLEILPNTVTCVKCSDEAPKAGRIITFGSGEEVYTELEVMDNETFKKIYRMEKGFNSEGSVDEEEFILETDTD